MKDLKFMDNLSNKEKYNNIYKYLFNEDLIHEVIYSERIYKGLTVEDYDDITSKVRKILHLKKRYSDKKYLKIAEKVILYILYSIFESKTITSYSEIKPLVDRDLFTARVTQSIQTNSKLRRNSKAFKIELIDTEFEIDKILDFLRKECEIKDSMFLFTLKKIIIENDLKELKGYLKDIFLFYRVDLKFLEKSVLHEMNNNIRKNSNKRYREWGYSKYRESFKDCFLMNFLRKDLLGFVFFTIDEDKDYIERMIRENGYIASFKYVEVNEKNYLITDRFKIRHSDNKLTITRLTIDGDYRKVKNCMLNSLRNINNVNNRYSGLQEISKFIYDNRISTNITHCLVKLNQFLYKYGYKRLRVLERKKNKNHFYYDKDKYYNFDIFEMRKMSNISYSRIIKEHKVWSIENNRNSLWMKFNDRVDTNFKGVYFRLLISTQKKDPIFDLDLKYFENELDIHHISKNKDNVSGNIVIISRKAHVLIESDKELNEFDSDKYMTNYVKINKLKSFRNKRKK